ncbi:hypothetical protein [Hymenobacter defluvii]|uniref:DDE-type integrase/transposase/recombinase n=1 Tax=Hymenobacter defluvii TaxID=2054411 RepID=A0ABS3TEC5_9BACT|nr:hypothetical protein [Hymenobacter defluvii]MBO3272007.1 hypothetical protein [Hymenobacter defluvii]
MSETVLGKWVAKTRCLPSKWRLSAFSPPTLVIAANASSRPPRTTQADPQAIAGANKLATWPAATAPNQIWVGDITYLALATGHTWLADALLSPSRGGLARERITE